MNASRYRENAFDVLLNVQDVEGPQKLSLKLICRRIVFEGVHSEKPFFVHDEISLRYREELGPRNFEVETVTEHRNFVDILLSVKHDILPER